MNKLQLLSGVFDASCFLLAHMDLYDATQIDIVQFRQILRILIKDSAHARVIEAEKELGFRDDKGNLVSDFEK